tara:strand:- start:228 stop:596 length:369 start_codon:yes stop_codon:yes gene_type:complete
MITSIVLIISLLVYGVLINSAQKNNYKFPPIISKCPEYWDISSNSNNTICKERGINNNFSNTANSSVLTINSDNNISYNTDIMKYNDKDSICGIYEWSNSNKISWSGITNDETLKTYCNKII